MGPRGSALRGLAVYVAGEDALDQFFCRHPDEFLGRPVEAAILDHESEQIHAAHLLCAAHEGPLAPGEADVLGTRWREHAERLVSAGLLVERRGAFQLRAPEDYPAARVPLRSSSADVFSLIDVASGEMIGTLEAARAFSTAHQGAVYLHLGRAYEVEQLDLLDRRALLRPFEGDWFTQPKRETMTSIERLIERRETMGVRCRSGPSS